MLFIHPPFGVTGRKEKKEREIERERETALNYTRVQYKDDPEMNKITVYQRQDRSRLGIEKGEREKEREGE